MGRNGVAVVSLLLFFLGNMCLPGRKYQDMF